MPLSSKTLALIGLALTNLFWASNAVLARFASDEIPPFTLSFGRWLVAFLLLLPFAIPHLKGKWHDISSQWLVIVVLGVLGVTIYNTVLYLAAHSTQAVNITLVSSTLPLITLLASWLMMGSRPSNWQLLGITASLLGIVIIISQGSLVQLLTLAFNRGDLLIFGIACCWSIYSVILRKYPISLHPIALLAVLMAAGLPFLFVLYRIEISVLPAFTMTIDHGAIIFYAALFPSIFAYLLWGYGVKQVGPNIASLSCYLMPLFTVMLAVPLLGESLYRYHLIGGLLILAGLYFGSLFRQGKSK